MGVDSFVYENASIFIATHRALILLVVIPKLQVLNHPITLSDTLPAFIHSLCAQFEGWMGVGLPKSQANCIALVSLVYIEVLDMLICITEWITTVNLPAQSDPAIWTRYCYLFGSFHRFCYFQINLYYSILYCQSNTKYS